MENNLNSEILNLREQKNLNQVFSNLSMQQNHLGLVKTQLTGPNPRCSDSVDLGSCPRICISKKLLGGDDIAGPRTTL